MSPNGKTVSIFLTIDILVGAVIPTLNALAAKMYRNLSTKFVRMPFNGLLFMSILTLVITAETVHVKYVFIIITSSSFSLPQFSLSTS